MSPRQFPPLSASLLSTVGSKKLINKNSIQIYMGLWDLFGLGSTFEEDFIAAVNTYIALTIFQLGCVA